MVLQAIKYSRGHLEVLDQLRLPHEEIYREIQDSDDAWHAINSMQVRGAPAIAIVAALSVAVEAARVTQLGPKSNANDTANHLGSHLDVLVTSRPTAVNLADAAAKLTLVAKKAAEDSGSDSRSVLEAYISAAEQMLKDDVTDNEMIGKHGAAWVLKNSPRNSPDTKVSVITHCNTG
ncbi:MAG: hypothetical protein Q9170_000080, partial [Blastenia crenularia]